MSEPSGGGVWNNFRSQPCEVCGCPRRGEFGVRIVLLLVGLLAGWSLSTITSQPEKRLMSAIERLQRDRLYDIRASDPLAGGECLVRRTCVVPDVIWGP
jgi:hypothetical protein